MNLNNRRRVLITGANGFIGRATLEVLLEKKIQVRAAARNIEERTLRTADCEWIQISDDWLNNASTFKDVAVVIHLAGRAHVHGDNASDAIRAFRSVNRDLSVEIAKAAIRYGVQRFVFISTIGVLGRVATPEKPFTVYHPPAPQEPYAVAKHEAELALQALADASKLELVIVRPTLVYGPQAPGNFRRLANAIAFRVPLPFGSVRNYRSLIYVRHLAELLSLCAWHPDAPGKVFLAADEELISTPDIIRALASGVGKRAMLLPVPEGLLRGVLRSAGAGRLYEQLCCSLVVDASEAREVLGWRPTYPMSRGLREMAQTFVRGCEDGQVSGHRA